MQLQAICGLYISYLSNLGGFHPNFRIIIYLFFSAEKVHSKSQQHKCVETLKVISSSFWITVQWHVKTVLLPLFDIKFHSSTRKTYRGCMCTVSTWASDYYTSPEHSSCYILWARVMSWFRQWKVEWLAGKLILELRAKGLQTTPKCPGTKCSGWMEGLLKAPLLWMGVATSHWTNSHSVFICVHLSLSLELSVIHYIIDNMKTALLSLHIHTV